MKPASLKIGVDVSSKELVIASFNDEQGVTHIGNTEASIKRWLAKLPAGSTVGMEATGIYHRLLAKLAFAAGHTVFVLNPKEVAHYLRSLRARGKTDVLDARGIARFVANETDQLHPYVPSTASQEAVSTLVGRRAQLVKARAGLRMSMDRDFATDSTYIALIKKFKEMIAQIDAQLRSLVAQDTALEARRKTLASIAGVGPLISAVLATRLNRTRYANSDALVAAIGYDPRPRESGQYTGKRQLSKRGNPEERRLLYLAGVSGSRTPAWRPVFDKLIAKGLSKTAAHCIIARKILRVAFAIWQSNEPFNPAMLGKA